jgi:hypothetical protein
VGHFVELFELCLGSQCYNNFVMVMNLARLKLNRSKWITFDEYLPLLPDFDDIFEPSNGRSLDVLRLRAEALRERGMYLGAKK